MSKKPSLEQQLSKKIRMIKHLSKSNAQLRRELIHASGDLLRLREAHEKQTHQLEAMKSLYREEIISGISSHKPCDSFFEQILNQATFVQP